MTRLKTLRNPLRRNRPQRMFPATRSLSQKIMRRTTDLLAVAIVAVGLLAVWGKLGRWWNTADPPDVTVMPLPAESINPWGQNGESVTLAWGDLGYAIHHQIVADDGRPLEKS